MCCNMLLSFFLKLYIIYIYIYIYIHTYIYIYIYILRWRNVRRRLARGGYFNFKKSKSQKISTFRLFEFTCQLFDFSTFPNVKWQKKKENPQLKTQKVKKSKIFDFSTFRIHLSTFRLFDFSTFRLC